MSAAGAVHTRALEGGALVAGPSFALPEDLRLPARRPAPTGHLGVPRGLQALALSPGGDAVALVGRVRGESIVTIVPADGAPVRASARGLTGRDDALHAAAFDRAGERLWVSAETGSATVLLLLDARTLAVLGALESPAFPPPAAHELHVHPVDDAVLLLAACGQDGTFARVAGFTQGDPPVLLPTSLDDGGAPAGMVGFSAARDGGGARVHLVEDVALRTHAWPNLVELASVDLPEDFASTYGGALLGDRIFLDGEDAETGDGDRVMEFDRSGLVGRVRRAGAPKGTWSAPPGMWIGGLGDDCIVTVEAKGEPARARVFRVPPRGG